MSWCLWNATPVLHYDSCLSSKLSMMYCVVGSPAQRETISLGLLILHLKMIFSEGMGLSSGEGGGCKGHCMCY